jgi:hypothetical protein
MTPPRWQSASAFVTSARRSVVLAQPCYWEIRGLSIGFVPSVLISAMPVQPRAEKTPHGNHAEVC